MRSRILLTAWILASVQTVARAAIAEQSAAVVVGTVVDSAGLAIADVEVSLVGIGTSVRTDGGGHFRLSSPNGLVTLSAKRLGFSPATKQVQSQPAEDPTPVSVVLNRLPTFLRPVVVKSQHVKYTGRLAGYYERLEKKNGGYFISRDQIDRENPKSLTQLLTRIPAVRSIGMFAGGQGVRMRGRLCWPIVWLDGLPMGAGETDLDAFPPSTLQGIELYLGSTTAPSKYIALRDESSCGTILLWSRGPDTDPPGKTRRKFDLESMVATLKVYTPEQVDEPASMDPAHPVDVDYPQAVFADNGEGSVIAEFVVNADGKVEEGTFGIVASTDARLSEAVQKAVEEAVFKPAKLKGSPVRQVVQQPFSFSKKGKKG